MEYYSVPIRLVLHYRSLKLLVSFLNDFLHIL